MMDLENWIMIQLHGTEESMWTGVPIQITPCHSAQAGTSSGMPPEDMKSSELFRLCVWPAILFPLELSSTVRGDSIAYAATCAYCISVLRHPKIRLSGVIRSRRPRTCPESKRRAQGGESGREHQGRCLWKNRNKNKSSWSTVLDHTETVSTLLILLDTRKWGNMES